MDQNIPTRLNNPGSLKDPTTGTFRSFSSPQEGYAALLNDLQSKVTGTSTTGLNANSTLYDFANTYAPSSDSNNPAQYTANLANTLGVRPDTKLGSLQGRIGDFAQAVAKNEGFTPAQSFQSGQQAPTQTPQNAPGSDTEPSLSQELGGRLNDLSSNVSDLAAHLTGGATKKSWISDVIQALGAAGGAVGDTVNKGLELIPGVKSVEGAIGGVVGKAAQTGVGQTVLKFVNDQKAAHPEIADDIGAGFNIFTAIPIFDGLAAVKDLAASATGRALRGIATKAVVDDLSDNIMVKGGKALAKTFVKNGGRDTLEAVTPLMNADTIPTIEGGKYAAQKAYENMGGVISDIDEKELQPALDAVSKNQSVGQSLTSLKNKAITAAENDETLRNAGAVPQAIDQINKRFAGWQHSFGDNIDLSTENKLKRGVRSYVNWNSPEGDSDAIIGKMFQKDIENVAKKNGLNDIAAINQKMGGAIKYQNMLKSLDGASVKTGLIRKTIQRGAGAFIGAKTGGLLGGGLIGEAAGGLLGEQASGIFGKKAIGGLRGSLARSEFTAPLVGGALKRAGRGLAAAAVQKSTR